MALSPFSLLVLALVGQGGASAHDIADSMRRGGRVFFAMSERQAYNEPKKLEQLGLLSCRSEPGRTHPRRVYRLTDEGLRALREGLAEPAHFPVIQADATIRLLAADLLDDDTVLTSLRGLRDDLDHVEARLDGAEQYVPERRRRYVELNYWLARELVEVHRRWLERVEQELGPRRDE
jgi:DNA-binding PadR family transcriptional regulator